MKNLKIYGPTGLRLKETKMLDDQRIQFKRKTPEDHWADYWVVYGDSYKHTFTSRSINEVLESKTSLLFALKSLGSDYAFDEPVEIYAADKSDFSHFIMNIISGKLDYGPRMSFEEIQEAWNKAKGS